MLSSGVPLCDTLTLHHPTLGHPTTWIGGVGVMVGEVWWCPNYTSHPANCLRCSKCYRTQVTGVGLRARVMMSQTSWTVGSQMHYIAYTLKSACCVWRASPSLVSPAQHTLRPSHSQALSWKEPLHKTIKLNPFTTYSYQGTRQLFFSPNSNAI